MHFYFFNDIMLNDTIFFTNFIQLVGGVSIESTESGFEINYDSLYPYGLLDMFAYDDYCLFSIFENISS